MRWKFNKKISGVIYLFLSEIDNEYETFTDYMMEFNIPP